MSTVFIYEGSQKIFVEEKFERPNAYDIQLYVWRSSLDQLGFNSDRKSSFFAKKLIESHVTLLIPKFRLISREEDESFSINNLTGVTFLNKNNLIQEEFKKYTDFEILKKKYALLERYKMPVPALEEPEIVRWYNVKSRKYTSEFSSFTQKNKLDFLVWTFSDMGICFYTFGNVCPMIECLAKEHGVELKIVTDMLKMPFY